MDERLIERLNRYFASLRRPLGLTDGQGNDVLDRRAPVISLPSGLKTGEPLFADGRVFMPSRAMDGLCWSVEAPDAASAADTLEMADMMLAELLRQYPDAAGQEYLYRQLLLNGNAAGGLDQALNAAGIVKKLPRCVLVFEMQTPWQGDFGAMVRSILPAGPTDVLTSVDPERAAYLMDMTQVDDREDLLDYASAVQESALSESGCSLLIGIGGSVEDVADLHTSFEQACEALRVGRIYQPKQTVFDYRRMLMPRFLSEVPHELAEKYHRMLFTAEVEKLFSDDLLDTVNMFFEKDLNLSDTARQLYIHRNTLTYRLDKIEKIIGLDLRRFEDAVTFKMLLEMKKCIR